MGNSSYRRPFRRRGARERLLSAWCRAGARSIKTARMTSAGQSEQVGPKGPSSAAALLRLRPLLDAGQMRGEGGWWMDGWVREGGFCCCSRRFVGGRAGGGLVVMKVSQQGAKPRRGGDKDGCGRAWGSSRGPPAQRFDHCRASMALAPYRTHAPDGCARGGPEPEPQRPRALKPGRVRIIRVRPLKEPRDLPVRHHLNPPCTTFG